jgi:ATP-dependent DNA ligase
VASASNVRPNWKEKPGMLSLGRVMPSQFIEPCLLTISRTVPTGRQWAYEIKHDGFRFICRRDGVRVRNSRMS